MLDSETDGDVPLSVVTERAMTDSLNRLNEVLNRKIRQMKTVEDLWLDKHKSKNMHGMESIVRNDSLRVSEFRSLVGGKNIPNKDWYITDQLLDHYAAILLVRRLDQSKKICFIRGQFGLGLKIQINHICH